MDSEKGLSDRFSDPPDREYYPLDPDNLFKIKSEKFIFVQFDGDSLEPAGMQSYRMHCQTRSEGIDKTFTSTHAYTHTHKQIYSYTYMYTDIHIQICVYTGICRYL